MKDGYIYLLISGGCEQIVIGTGGESTLWPGKYWFETSYGINVYSPLEVIEIVMF